MISSLSLLVMASLVFPSLQQTAWEKLQNDKELKLFLGHLEKFETTKNDVVFVLDESGSIEIARFPHVIKFTELIARQLSISPSDSRTAVLTFGTQTRYHVNYIEHPFQKNMCTFMADLDKIDYAGGWTYTGDAMVIAKQILDKGRASSNKIIFLLTDGQSNGGVDLGTISKEVKRDGVEVFVVGVANVNTTELHIVATSDEHVYIVKDFELIVALNQYLIYDTKEVNYDHVNSTLCDSYCSGGTDCCDEHAHCYCGTKSGNYTCACAIGYGGTSGYRGQCKYCPLGTYKNSIGNSFCEPCPAYSTTSKPGCVSLGECSCIAGYVGDPGRNVTCKPVECSVLKPPSNGRLFPLFCGNTYGSECKFKCNEGYCPYSCNEELLQKTKEPWHIVPHVPRICLESGTWSGEDFICEKITCPPLEYPKYGNHNCSADTDFSFGTVCEVTCNKGYIHKGGHYRTCMVDRKWKGAETVCTGVTCAPLKTNQHLQVKPRQCGLTKVPYQTTCQYYCKRGFLLRSYDTKIASGIRNCQFSGKWTNVQEQLFCEDIEPPVLFCPASIKHPADKGRATARLSWNLPLVQDNSAIRSLDLVEPRNIYKRPHTFSIGSTKIVYLARDLSGNVDSCSFTVNVIDDQPPNIDRCPSDIVVKHSKRSPIAVNWTEPVFSDNSGQLQVTPNRKNGELFKWAPSNLITYLARDPSGNVANCSFSVTVVPHSCEHVAPPVNGFLTCDDWTNGQLCSVSCKKGFAFSVNFESVYFCSQRKRKWTSLPSSQRSGSKFLFPWPDCSAILPPKLIDVSVTINFTTAKCSEEELDKAKEDFINTLKAKYPSFCPVNKGCVVKNVKATCSDSGKDPNTRGSLRNAYNSPSLSRHKRSDDSSQPLLVLSFDIEIDPSPLDVQKCVENCLDASIDVQTSYEHGVDVEGALLTSVTDSLKETYRIKVADPHLSFAAKSTCRIGSLLKNDTCVNCPVGTFFNVSMLECQICPNSYYQDVEGSLSCKSCPEETFTLVTGSRKVSDCKAPCKRGTFSVTGLEPCEACPKGYYQEDMYSLFCLPCPRPSTTTFTGASLSADCILPCPMGTFSYSGYSPCTLCRYGTYQPFTQQNRCYNCSIGTTTVVEGAPSQEYCQTVFFCKDFQPCKNGANCSDTSTDYSCLCTDGFTGKNCDVNTDDCSPEACENAGVCIDGVNSFTCQCPQGYNGSRCEFDIDDCQSEPCGDHGSCKDLVDGYICNCERGFSGTNCEINVDDCDPNPCFNEGICFDKKDGFRCCCREGYSGDLCRDEVNKCVDKPCFNSGNCTPVFNGYQCECPLGFNGSKCEENIDDCIPLPCANGGTCMDGINSFSCSCPTSHFGILCEEVVPPQFLLNFPKPVAHQFVLLQNKKYLRGITVSFFMQTSYVDEKHRATPVSYSYFDTSRSILVDNALTLLDTNGLILSLHGQTFHTGYAANSDPYWHHYAVTWESFNGSWTFYVDGKVIASGSNVATGGYFYPGVFVLGQEQDSLGGTFNLIESFVGQISEFNVWDFDFTPVEIFQLSEYCTFVGNLIPWSETLSNTHGKLDISTDDYPCNNALKCPVDQCYCKSNIKGTGLCRPKVDACKSDTCYHDQTCVINETSAVCDCSEGFTGRFCQYDIDECLSDNGYCSHTCLNTLGSYKCSCPQDMILNADGRTCRETFCKVADNVFLNGEHWESLCNNCTCLDGLMSCEKLQCQNQTCGKDEKEVLLPGHCCEMCLSYSSCSLENNDVETFDSMNYKLFTNCSYILVKDCIMGSFAISWEVGNAVRVSTSCTNVVITADGNYTINDGALTVPLDKIFIHVQGSVDPTKEASTLNCKDSLHVGHTVGIQSSDAGNSLLSQENGRHHLQIVTHDGVMVEWYNSNHVVVSLPQSLERKTCGLCGNYNGNPKDDLASRVRLPSNKLSDFIRSWKTDKDCQDNPSPVHALKLSSRRKALVTQKAKDLMWNRPWVTLKKCPYLTEQHREMALKGCSTFWDEHFHPCHDFVDPNAFHVLCLKRSCSCRSSRLCFCDVVLTYVDECRKRNIFIESLESAYVCGEGCIGGMVHKECGPKCPPTCSSSNLTSHCSTKWQCSLGCYCPEDTVLHAGRCMEPALCSSLSL